VCGLYIYIYMCVCVASWEKDRDRERLLYRDGDAGQDLEAQREHLSGDY
jgi:hypothetical protein